MLMDCDISIINGGYEDDTVCDTDSPKKTVKMITDAQLTHKDDKSKPKESRVKLLLKKIEAASKIQVYLLQSTLPTAQSEEKRAMIY